MEEHVNFVRDLDSVFFLYAHITAALEIYIHHLEIPALQLSTNKILTGAEGVKWERVGRFMPHEGKQVVWYPYQPIEDIIKNKKSLFGFIYGITISKIVGDIDYLLNSILKNHYGVVNTSGNSWIPFIDLTKIDLLKLRHGDFIYALIQERHKIEHNKAIIDDKFIKRLVDRNILPAYQAGDPIQKSHIDVLVTFKAAKEFAEDVESNVERLIKNMEAGGRPDPGGPQE